MILSRITFLLLSAQIASSSLPRVPLPKNRLQLETELGIFTGCSIHLVVNHINFNYSAQNDGSYNLEPFQNTPIILSQYNFNIQPHSSSFDLTSLLPKGGMYCDDFNVQLAPRQGFKFQAIPGPKVTCFVQVFIDPVPCKKWSLASEPEILGMPQRNAFSGSFLDSIFHYKIDKERESVAKPGLICIHITQRREFDNFFADILFRIDYYWQIQTFYHSYSYIQPTKILLQIELVASTKQEIINEVIEGSLLTCHEYKSWWQRGIEACKELEKSKWDNFFYAPRCHMSALHGSAELPVLLDYKQYNPETWKDLEALRANSDACKHGKFALISPYAGQIKNLDHFYIPDLVEFVKGKKQPGIVKHEQLMESLTWGLLQPNSTLLGNGNKNTGKLFTHTYFPFIYPQTTNIVHSESIGYIGPLDQVHFVTCAPLKEHNWLSLIGLVAAFEWRLWLVIGITSTVCGITVYFMLQFSQIYITQKKIGTSVTVIGFVWDVLLGQGNSAVEKVRWIGGTWALVGVVLTNAYLGDNINMLTAPLPIQKVEKFDELFQSNFSIYSTILDDYRYRAVEALFKESSAGVLLHKHPEGGIRDLKKGRISVFSALFILRNMQLSEDEATIKAHEIENISDEMFEANNKNIETAGTPEHYANIIGKCGMDAYVDTKANLDRVYHKLKQRFRFKKDLSEQLTMSQDTYGEICNSWLFGNIPWPATMFLKKVHGLLESGLVGIWKEWSHWVETIQDEMRNAKEEQAEYVPVTLYGNVRALFFFYLSITLLPLLIFGIETRKIWGLLYRKITVVSEVENINAGQHNIVFKHVRKVFLRLSNCFAINDVDEVDRSSVEIIIDH
ncbi:unnamed protein product [Orchesella dallaii]|uniref:Uncharacterized protein n=1 Tax=Orchesella dallaii TaxID=48710 RepID=A0ABP1PT53_9HEXA